MYVPEVDRMDGNNTRLFSAAGLKITLKGVPAGLIVSFALMLIFAGLMLWLALPAVWASVFAYAATALGAFAGGFVSGVMAGGGGLKFGALTGAAIFAVAFFAGVIAGRAVPGVGAVAVSAGISVAFAALGGAVGVNRR